MTRSGAALRALAWLVSITLVSLGGAGLAVSADHLPGDATRPERTWTADVAFRAAMVPATGDFGTLSSDVNTLGDTARTALIDLVARRDDLLAADLAQGDRLVTLIDARASALSATLDAITARVPLAGLGDASRSTLSTARAAVAATRPLAGDWKTLADGALPAIRLAGVLDQHDQLTFAAIQQAHKSAFAAALADLRKAGAVLDQARQTRDALQSRADVSTLTAWIDRAGTYDAALAALYTELKASGGRMTARATKLAAAVAAAQKLLPPDTKALVVIMGDIAQAGLYQAAIGIEQARGDLARTVAALH